MKTQTTKPKLRLTAAFTLLVMLSQSVSPALACGPFILEPLFSFNRHPDYPLAEYAKGNPGVIPESFGRMSLFVFYRQLNNLPLTPNEQKQVVEAMKVRIGGGDHWSNRESPQNNTQASAIEKKPDHLEMWKSTRAKVLGGGGGGDPKISTDKREENDYHYIPNCLPDAFRNAASTLEQRAAKYGAQDPGVKEWLNGQDAVFSNCNTAGKIPDPLPEDVPGWLRKDRQYQIAAALFYSDKLPAARAAFEAIAADENSVWNKTAKFVVARTYIRQASFIDDSSPDYAPTPKPPANDSPNSNANANYGSNISNTMTSVPAERKEIKSIDEKKKEKADLLRKAEIQLRNILKSSEMNEFHPSAQRLLNLVEYRSDPLKRRNELARILALPSENLNIYNDLIDYIWLLDRVESDAGESGSEIDRKEAEQAGKEPDYGYEYTLKLRDVPPAERATDLTDWLFTYQADDGYTHALEKWRATKKISWLVVALVKADSKSPQMAEILAAADQIPKDSPAFATARHSQIRLLLEIGKRSEAKQKLDEISAADLAKFNVSTQNKFSAQRMISAQKLDEFLKYAQRRPATFVWSDDANEEGTDLNSPAIFDGTDLQDKKMRAWANRTMFDEDAVAFFNEKMPLSVLRQAALSPQLPDHLKKFLVAAVWTRAFILRNQAVEREFTPLMAKYAPEYGPLFSKYAAAAAGSSQREAAALVAILRYPVIQPFVPVGYGREDSPPTSLDSIRGNWWCVKDQDEEYRVFYDRYTFKHPAVYPTFLSAAQTVEADREQKLLKSGGNSATYLTRRAVEFATQNPNHAQTPEILHLAVRSTRYGCRDEETGRLSKQAFQILHRRYPNSEWTKKTPYWFGQT